MKKTKIFSKLSFKITVSALSLFFIFSACSQKQNNKTTTVKIKLPSFSEYRSKINSKSAVHAASTTSSTNKYYPSVMSEINCYAIAVGGPEATMSRSYCDFKKDSLSSAASQTVTTVIDHTAKFGILKGFYPENSTISLEVPAGSDRKFYLIGVQATNTSYCTDINSQNDNGDNVSEPYVIGESAAIALLPDTDNKVVISIPSASSTLTYNLPYIDGDACAGPDVPDNNNSNQTSVVSNFSIEKFNFPTDTFVGNSCNTFSINYHDQWGHSSSIGSDTLSFSLENANYGGSWTTVASPVIYLGSVCSGTQLSNNQYSITATQSNQVFSYYTSSDTAYPQYRITTYSSTLASSAVKTFSNLNSYSNATEIIGPENILPGVCYNYKIIEKKLNNSFNSSATGTFTFSSIYPTNTQLYSGTGCSNLISTNTINFVSSTATFSLKVPNQLGLSELKISSFGSTATSQTLTKSIRINRGVTDVNRIELYSKNEVFNLGSGVYCYGPIYANFVNQNGTVVPVNAATIINFNVASHTVTSPDVFYGISTDCSNSYSSSYSASIPADGTGAGATFFLKTYFTSGTTYTATLAVSATYNNTDYVNSIQYFPMMIP